MEKNPKTPLISKNKPLIAANSNIKNKESSVATKAIETNLISGVSGNNTTNENPSTTKSPTMANSNHKTKTEITNKTETTNKAANTNKAA